MKQGNIVAERSDKKLKHLVCVRFKPGTTEEQIRQVETAFAQLSQKVSGITGFETGRNVSAENKDKGFTHIWILTFESEKMRDRYLTHPDHQAFSKVLATVRDDVFVFDYFSPED